MERVMIDTDRETEGASGRATVAGDDEHALWLPDEYGKHCDGGCCGGTVGREDIKTGMAG